MQYMKSGEFAELCGTTKDTLIHYDRIGLFRPVAVSDSGYRLYAPSQRYRFTAIRVLVDTGMPLDDVRAALASGRPGDIAAALSDTRDAVEAKIAALQGSLRRINELARQAAASEDAALGVPAVVHRPERRLAVFGMRATGDDLFAGSAAANRDLEVAELLREAGPEAEVAPYGGVCGGPVPQAGGVAYDDLFYVLPEGAEYAGDTETLAGGDFLALRYEGPSDGLAHAHAALAAEAARLGADGSPRYEISVFRLLDEDDGVYRCVIETPLR